MIDPELRKLRPGRLTELERWIINNGFKRAHCVYIGTRLVGEMLWVKVGMTADPVSRFRSYRTGMAGGLDGMVALAMPAARFAAIAEAEIAQEIHSLGLGVGLSPEWYEAPPQNIDAIYALLFSKGEGAYCIVPGAKRTAPRQCSERRRQMPRDDCREMHLERHRAALAGKSGVAGQYRGTLRG